MALPLTEDQKKQKRTEHTDKIGKLVDDLAKSEDATKAIRTKIDAAIRDLNQETLK